MLRVCSYTLVPSLVLCHARSTPQQPCYAAEGVPNGTQWFYDYPPPPKRLRAKCTPSSKTIPSGRQITNRLPSAIYYCRVCHLTMCSMTFNVDHSYIFISRKIKPTLQYNTNKKETCAHSLTLFEAVVMALGVPETDKMVSNNQRYPFHATNASPYGVYRTLFAYTALTVHMFPKRLLLYIPISPLSIGLCCCWGQPPLKSLPVFPPTPDRNPISHATW